jgi:hypothetical protein
MTSVGPPVRARRSERHDVELESFLKVPPDLPGRESKLVEPGAESRIPEARESACVPSRWISAIPLVIISTTWPRHWLPGRQ